MQWKDDALTAQYIDAFVCTLGVRLAFVLRPSHLDSPGLASGLPGESDIKILFISAKRDLTVYLLSCSLLRTLCIASIMNTLWKAWKSMMNHFPVMNFSALEWNGMEMACLIGAGEFTLNA